MKRTFLTIILMAVALVATAQQLLILDRFNGKKVINDSTVTVFSSDFELPELTQYYVLKNNTDRTLDLFLRKTVNIMSDSTTDYFCFGAKCWPGYDSTDIPLTIPAGAMDSTFASHVCHVRRLDRPPLVPGLSSITYTIYDRTAFPQPVEASVTVIYHLGGLGIGDRGNRGQVEKVYPNPARDKITVETVGMPKGRCSVTIFNSGGSVVSCENTDLHDNKITLSLNHLPPGLYFGKVVSESGNTSLFRFSVVH